MTFLGLSARDSSPRSRTLSGAVAKVEEYQLPATTREEKSYRAVYEALFDPLVRYARSFLAPDDAEDAVQATMLAAWKGWETIAPSHPTAGYFYRAVRNRITRTRLRERDRSQNLVELTDVTTGDFAVAAPADTELEMAEVAAVIEAAVSSMSPACREAWRRVREEHASYADAAHALGVSVSAVKQNLMRANAVVLQALAAAGYGGVTLPRLPRHAKPQLLPPGSPSEPPIEAPTGEDDHD